MAEQGFLSNEKSFKKSSLLEVKIQSRPLIPLSYVKKIKLPYKN